MNILQDKKRLAIGVLSIYIAFVFVQSLFFKYTNSPETQHIFSVLDAWAAGLGFEGLFLPPGIFNAYVIGTAELIASILLLAGFFMKRPLLSVIGAALAFDIISGAIFFHLATPLGINVQGDGGVLFSMAVGVWLSSVALLILYKDTILGIFKCKNKASS